MNHAGGAFIDGAWRREQLTLPVTDPEDGRLLGFVADCSAADVSAAIGGVAASLDEDEWPLWARGEALHRAAHLVRADADRLTGLISSEGVKTIREARREVERCAETLRLSAEATAVLSGETIPFAASRTGNGKTGWFTREPVGVVAAITSFNDPLNLVAHKVGPALIGGNGVVVKPSEHTPFTALALAGLLVDAGVPARRIAVVPGGVPAGHALVTDPRVAVVSFTGGSWTAGAIAAAAGARKLLMELGGNNPTIVCADADLPAAARAVVAGAFGVAGQNCLSVQRVYVDSARFAEFLDLAVQATGKLVVGGKGDPDTDVGPLITESEARRIESWVADAAAAGAVIHTGGTRDGAYYQPTILSEVPEDSRVLCDEVFGPVVSLVPVDDMDQAIRNANTGKYALQAGVFTRSVPTAFDIAARLVAGSVVVNGTSDVRVDSMPFGGFKNSGIGREGVRFAVEAMTEPKNIIVNLTG